MAIITVGCKLPNGIEIEVNGKSVVLNGQNTSAIAGGHGITEVDADFFAQWMEKNKDLVFVQRGLVFANKTVRDVAAMAKEVKDEKTGLEGLDPNAKHGGVEQMSV